MADNPNTLVTALWTGSHVAELPDRTRLTPGESTYRVPRAEAETSENWQYPITPATPPTAAEIIAAIAEQDAEWVAAVLEAEQATASPRKTVVEAAQKRLTDLKGDS